MPLKVPGSTIITYKYSIQMTHIRKTITSFKRKLINQYTDKLMNGKLLVLIDPIYRVNKNTIFVHPVLDIDIGFESGFSLVKNFLSNNKRKKLWYAEYTGKTGFHLYFKYMVLIKDPNLFKTPSILRRAIFEPISNNLLKNVDQISSIRDIPIVRIGYRPDTHKTAVPLLNLTDPKWVLSVSKIKGLKGAFSTSESLITYINNYLIPPEYINLKQYNSLARI